MVHGLSYIIFILVFTAWLGFELKIKHALSKNWIWIAAAVMSAITGSVLSEMRNNDLIGNFLLHGIGGGIASAFLYGYLLKTLRLQFPWRLELVLLFGFVSALGVLNELAEYFIEFFAGIIMSYDTHDTWRDFVANTSGALAAWLVLKMLGFINLNQKNSRG